MSDNPKYDKTIARIVDKVTQELDAKQKELTAEQKLTAKVIDCDRQAVKIFTTQTLINQGPLTKADALVKITKIYREILGSKFSKDELIEVAAVSRASQAVSQISEGLF